jgi:hypothetical protein
MAAGREGIRAAGRRLLGRAVWVLTLVVGRLHAAAPLGCT